MAEPKLPPPSPNPHMQDHIFVSYSSKDRAFVDQLAKELRDQGHIVWIDFEGIRGGDLWKQSIADGLHPSRVVLLVLSPESVASEWVEEEIRMALESDKPVIPLLLRQLPSKIEYPTLKYVLREIQYRDFTKGFQSPFQELLKDMPQPKSGVPGYCQKIAAKLAALPWGFDHYIQEKARLLPVNASPYEDGVVTGQAEDLIERLWQSRRTIVLGEPGIGKSVALERLAWELATNDPPVIPIIIKLLEYDGESLLEWVRLSINEINSDIRLQTYKEAENFLKDRSRKIYFLLDGLNEVRPPYREAIENAIPKFAKDYPQHSIVITSRIQDESWRFLRHSVIEQTLLVQPIQPEQARHYLTAHLGINDGNLLWNRLDERMRGLAATPLLLWMIKEAWLEARRRNQSNQVRIPENRGELYSNFVSRMLRRDDERRLSHNVSEARRLAALELIALALHGKKSLVIAHDDALELIEDEGVLEALLVNGLLLGERELRFAPHQTMQEHFAARALQKDLRYKLLEHDPNTKHKISKYATDPWWAETFIQLAGVSDDSDRLGTTLAEVNPWLAYWCIQEGRDVQDTTLAYIQAKSIALVNSTEIADRRNVVQFLARMKSTRVIEPLAQLAGDGDAEVRQIARAAVQEYGESAITALVSVLEKADVQSVGRANIGSILTDIGDSRPGIGLHSNGLPDIAWTEIPSGMFKMGGDKEAYKASVETVIELPYPYWMAKYPVTYKQYEAFVSSDGYNNQDYWTKNGWEWKKDKTQPEYGWNVPQWHISNHSITRVTWYEAYAFCRWLTANLRHTLPSGWEIRLPSEAEWEKAARYPDGRKFPWGNIFYNNFCNTKESEIRHVIPVGMYPQGTNPKLNIYDLSGNVWEWCMTKWSEEYHYPEDNAIEGNDMRVLRGGAWFNIHVLARAAARFRVSPTNTDYYPGFRVCAAPSLP